jgi:hypothetical protein
MATIRLLMVTSHPVKAYSASISCSAATPAGARTSISTSSAVKSLMLLTLSLPLRAASSIEATSDSVVVVGGMSLMTTVDSSLTLIRARTWTLPRPSAYPGRPSAPRWGNRAAP